MNYGIDYSSLTQWCGTCETALISAFFSEDWLTIVINFDFQIEIIG